ncbi:MAG: CopG family transcriptional regulator [Acidobacteriota bacterium]
MASEKVSLTLDETLLASARRRVGGRGLSGYINDALRFKLQQDRLSGLLQELEEEHGAIDPETVEEVRAAWPDDVSAQRRSA